MRRFPEEVGMQRVLQVVMHVLLVLAVSVAAPVRAAEGDVEPNVVAYEDYNDPLEGLNRRIFAFNDVAYRSVLIPAANAYMKLPRPARSGIGNFFENVRSPISLVNHVAQGEMGRAGTTGLRLLINTTIGLAGLFDPADHWFDLEEQQARTGETFARYGAGYGFYLVIPLVGPSTARDGTGIVVDALLNPLRYLLDNPESLTVRTFGNFQSFAPAAETYLATEEESEDPYLFMRNLHLQGLQRDEDY